MLSLFPDIPWVTWVLVPILIFSARIMDVSIGTMRVIFISRGYKMFAAVSGFFEVLIWVFAITQILSNLTNPVYYIAYAGGFATGNYVGMRIEEKIALGKVLVRVITPNNVANMTDFLRKRNFGVTTHDARGLYGNVKILFTIIPRRDLDTVVDAIRKLNPKAFYTVEDVRYVHEISSYRSPRTWRVFRRPLRKGK